MRARMSVGFCRATHCAGLALPSRGAQLGRPVTEPVAGRFPRPPSRRSFAVILDRPSLSRARSRPVSVGVPKGGLESASANFEAEPPFRPIRLLPAPRRSPAAYLASGTSHIAPPALRARRCYVSITAGRRLWPASSAGRFSCTASSLAAVQFLRPNSGPRVAAQDACLAA